MNKALYRQALARDHGCVECGSSFVELHHIISRGRKGADCIENVICLCPYHHRLADKGAGAHTTAKRKEHLEYLQDRYGYKYTERAWVEALNA